MSGRLDGRVAVVTGAGRGLGRDHALALAAEGAAVVVNDLGGDVHGAGLDATPAQQVVAMITDAGGRAVVSGHDVADWDQAGQLVALAVGELGGLDIVVNNAGILRDRTIAKLTEPEWDAVVRVHLKGHAAVTHHACSHWRKAARTDGQPLAASIVHTSSASGLIGNFGQAAYGAAKLGIVALSRIVALEMGSIGVRSNVIAPVAATRMGAATPSGGGTVVREDGFDLFDPANVSPLVVWLALSDCPAQAQVFNVYGDRVTVLSLPHVEHDLRSPERRRWTVDELDLALRDRLVEPPSVTEMISMDPAQ